jgi:membrane-associated phospholipid phosphatase
MSDQALIATPSRLRTRTLAPAPGSALSALAIAGVLALALAAVWALASQVGAIRAKDAVVLYHFTTLDGATLHPPLTFLLHLLDPALFVLWGIALIAFALAGERPRSALAVAGVLTLAPFTAEQLKPLMAHQHDSVDYVTINSASWPSGHATAAMAMALCAVLASGPRLRPVVAILAGLYVAAVCVGLLVLAWHMPSDVIGGLLLASLWMALAVAALRASERVFPPRRAAPG